MRLDRNIKDETCGKYALLKLRQIPRPVPDDIVAALATLTRAGILDWGNKLDTEFFLIRLKDCYAEHALTAYALAARKDDSEYARDVANLAQRAGRRNPHCKRPD